MFITQFDKIFPSSPNLLMKKRRSAMASTKTKLYPSVILLFLIFILGQKCNFVHSANMACKEVKYKYSARSSKDYKDNPLVPESESALQICPQGPSCCTPDMELRMRHKSSIEYREAVNNKTTVMANPFKTKASKLHDFIEKLLDDSQKQFHDIFQKTYGELYNKNSHIFRNYFEELRKYFYHGRVDIDEVTKNFFSTLYQKMFQVMNLQFSFDKKYLLCVAENMDEILPFGDIPEKLASSLRKTFLSSRTMYKAILSAFDIADKMKSLEPTKECLTAIQKMNSCPACQGFQDIRPCSNYCINVMKGCLVFHIELQTVWDQFIDALKPLGNQLQNVHNLERLLLTTNSPNLPLQISDAIMEFQRKSHEVHQKVFDICGRPKTYSKRDIRDVSLEEMTRNNTNADIETNVGFADQIPVEAKASAIVSDQSDLVKSNMLKNDFKKIIKEVAKLGEESQGFWRHLPYVLCDQPVDKFQEKLYGKIVIKGSKESNNEKCWNGHNSGPYNSEIVEDGLVHLSQNPEIHLSSPLIQPVLLKAQANELKHITIQLKSAHTGQNVEWWDEKIMTLNDESEDNDFEGSGAGFSDDEDYEEGSGNGVKSTHELKYVGDDEDYDEDGSGCEGSGECSAEPTTTKTPWKPWTPPSPTPIKTSSITPPTPTTTSTTTTLRTSTTSRPNVIAGASNPAISCNVAFMSLATILLYWLVL